MFLIVPNDLSDKLYAAIDREIEKVPDAAKDRDALYEQLLSVFNETGVIPEFTLRKRESV